MGDVIGVRTLVRALLHRLGTTVVILIVALCATAAATVGPTYYAAARHSILQDTLADASVVSRGFQAAQQGPVKGSFERVSASVDNELDRAIGGAAVAERLFQPPIGALETRAFFSGSGENVPLVWRTSVCAHLRIQHGRCATARGEVAVSTSLAALNHWAVGQQLHPAGKPPLTITGVYVPPEATGDYWFARGTTYFPAELPAAQSLPYDAMFTPRVTIEQLPGNPQGTDVVARPLDRPQVQPADVDALNRFGDRLTNSPELTRTATTVVTGLADTTETVHSSWRSLAVPVVVVTAELLVLTWLLLFLVVTDAVDARGTEIALAKLRGFGGGRSVAFGLSEPVVLLALALPAGAVLGWALTGLLAQVLLRPGTSVGLPGLGWAAAVIATAGGIAAVVVAAHRTLTRPVVEQWRRTGRKATDRGWVFDAVVLTGAVAGLAQLELSGTLDSARHSALALLVPGLLGLAIAVVASRLLPVICRATFGRTRRSGTLGPFLAVRHMARRPGGTRTTMILATAVALATFSIAAWSIGTTNRNRVADLTVGAPTVLTVAPAVTDDLGAVVERADPGGHNAAAVETFDSEGTNVVAVQPKRFAAVANWDAGFVGNPGRLLADLSPPAPRPLVVDGDDIRVRLDVGRLSVPNLALDLNVVATGATAPTPISLGQVSANQSVTRVGGLSACPCVVRDLSIVPVTLATQIAGDVTVRG